MPSGVPTRVPGTHRLAPAALPDAFAVVVLVGTLLGLVALRIGAFRLMIGWRRPRRPANVPTGHSWFQGGGTTSPMSDPISQGERS
jgi:hypothetical protein